MTDIVKFYPEEDSELAKVAEVNKRDYLTASVESQNKNGSINVIVSVPDGQNVLVKNVSSKKDASPRFEEVQ